MTSHQMVQPNTTWVHNADGNVAVVNYVVATPDGETFVLFTEDINKDADIRNYMEYSKWKRQWTEVTKAMKDPHNLVQLIEAAEEMLKDPVSQENIEQLQNIIDTMTKG